jgi:hypothetical protein
MADPTAIRLMSADCRPVHWRCADNFFGLTVFVLPSAPSGVAIALW